MAKKRNYEVGEDVHRVAVYADAQVPYHDPRAFALFLEFLHVEREEGRPFSHVVNLGDEWDAEQFSTNFARDPRAVERVRRDRDTVRNRFRRLRESSPDSEIIWVEGNHEFRLFRYLRDKAPEILMLLTEGEEAPDVPTILGLDVPVTHIAPYGEMYQHKFGKKNTFVFKHGDSVSVYAAKKELETVGASGMSGHTHRFQVASLTKQAGHQSAWWSLPAMCNIRGTQCPPGYMTGSGYRQWQQGFADIWFGDKDDLFEVNTHIVENGKMIAGGRLFKDVRGT